MPELFCAAGVELAQHELVQHRGLEQRLFVAKSFPDEDEGHDGLAARVEPEGVEGVQRLLGGLMERQMEAMSVLRSMTPQANDNVTKSFTGWKVKIEYEGKDSGGKPYHSEYWFILDKEAQCVIKSFEIPLM